MVEKKVKTFENDVGSCIITTFRTSRTGSIFIRIKNSSSEDDIHEFIGNCLRKVDYELDKIFIKVLIPNGVDFSIDGLEDFIEFVMEFPDIEIENEEEDGVRIITLRAFPKCQLIDIRNNGKYTEALFMVESNYEAVEEDFVCYDEAKYLM